MFLNKIETGTYKISVKKYQSKAKKFQIFIPQPTDPSWSYFGSGGVAGWEEELTHAFVNECF